MAGEILAQYRAGEPLDLGIDVAMQRKLQSLLADTILRGQETKVAIGHPSDLIWQVRSKEDLLDYAATLAYLLSLHPDQPTSKLKRDHIQAAAEIGFGLSPSTYYTGETGNFTEAQTALGWAASDKLRFKSWTQADCIHRAKQIFEGKPSLEAIKVAAQDGKMPGAFWLRSRFGTIVNFYEQMGYVHVYGWTVDDYMDWGVAYKMQNEGGALSWPIIRELGTDRAPGRDGILDNFDSLVDFDTSATREFQARLHHLADYRAGQLLITDQLCEEDPKLAEVLRGKSQNDRLRISGQYRLVEELLPHITASRRFKIAKARSADGMAKTIVRINESIGMTMGEVEIVAAELGVYDIIWPMNTYRFQQVDLTLAA